MSNFLYTNNETIQNIQYYDSNNNDFVLKFILIKNNISNSDNIGISIKFLKNNINCNKIINNVCEKLYIGNNFIYCQSCLIGNQYEKDSYISFSDIKHDMPFDYYIETYTNLYNFLKVSISGEDNE